MQSLDTLRLNFNPSAVQALNVVLALVMFGVALDLRVADFKRVVISGKGVAIGICTQMLLLPALTYLMVIVIQPPPSVALGMILVGACPGGNMSNFITHRARGDTALSVTITAMSAVAAFISTPMNLAFWGGLNPLTRQILHDVSLDSGEVVQTVLLILALPLAFGMTLATRWPTFAARLRKPMNQFTMIVFALMIISGVAGNYKAFIPYLGMVGGIVLIHNGGALALGYFAAWVFRLPEADRRAISIEVGMQNSGLGLVLIFNHFEGNGGMALIAAWWGIWHIISGLILSSWWQRREPRP